MPKNYSNPICQNCEYYKNIISNNKRKIIYPLELETHNSDTLLIFQNPGIDEWDGKNSICSLLSHKPISSNNAHSTAMRMKNSFKRKNVKRCDYDITEAVQCYMGKKDDGRDKKPSAKIIASCKEHLKKDIIKGNYKKIVVFGKVAEKSVKDIVKSMSYNAEIIYLPHPSSHLSNEDLDKGY